MYSKGSGGSGSSSSSSAPIPIGEEAEKNKNIYFHYVNISEIHTPFSVFLQVIQSKTSSDLSRTSSSIFGQFWKMIRNVRTIFGKYRKIFQSKRLISAHPSSMSHSMTGESMTTRARGRIWKFSLYPSLFPLLAWGILSLWF